MSKENPKLENIKSMEPCASTVKQLERMLEDAKSGELRSVYSVAQYEDRGVSHAWSINEGFGHRLMLAEMTLGLHDFTASILIREGDSGLVFELDN